MITISYVFNEKKVENFKKRVYMDSLGGRESFPVLMKSVFLVYKFFLKLCLKNS